MTVRSFLPDEGTWSTMAVGGPTPPTRSGHSATLVSNEKIIVFGGEDRRRKLHAEVNILDLNHMLWEEVTIEVLKYIFYLSISHQKNVANNQWRLSSSKNILLILKNGFRANYQARAVIMSLQLIGLVKMS